MKFKNQPGRWNIKKYLSKHKHVQLISGNKLVTYPVMYEEEFDYSGSDEMFHAHQIVLCASIQPIEGRDKFLEIAFPQFTNPSSEYEKKLFKMKLKERINALNPKIFVSYGSVLPID